MLAQGQEGGDGAGCLGRDVVAPGAAGFVGEALAAQLAAQALSRRANRPAIRIRCVSSSWSSLPPCSRRPQVRNPPGLCPRLKQAFSTIRATQSEQPATRSPYREAKATATPRP